MSERFYYADLQPNENGVLVVEGESQLAGEVDAPNMVRVSADLYGSLIGKHYVDGQFVDAPQE